MKCMFCQRSIPPDELELVKDRLTVYCRPLTELLGMSSDKIVDQLLTNDDALCAKCFNEMNEQQPLDQFISRIAKHPTEVDGSFEFKLLRRGVRHG